MEERNKLRSNLENALGEEKADILLGIGKEEKLEPEEYLRRIIGIVRTNYYAPETSNEGDPGFIKEEVWFDPETSEWVISVPVTNLRLNPWGPPRYIKATLGDGTRCWLEVLTYEIRLSEPEGGFTKADICSFYVTQARFDTFNGGGFCRFVDSLNKYTIDEGRLDLLMESLNRLKVEGIEGVIRFPRSKEIREQASRILDLHKSGKDTSGEIYWYFCNTFPRRGYD